jgi:tetratricopeptide (TPR) repeat protein
MKLYAIADASRFYERAIGAARRLRGVQPPDRTGLYERLSDALYLLGRYDQADRALKSARRFVRADPLASAPLAVKQAIITTRTGRYRQANLRIARAIRALEAARGRDAAANRARLMVIVAGIRYFENRRTESIEWSRRAANEARRSQAKDALAQAYKLLDLALKENGQIEKAVYSRRALALYEELGDLRNQALVLNNLGILAQERSHWDEALELYQRALAIMDRLGDRANAGLAKYNIAEILSDQGRLDEAETLLRDVLRVWRASGAEADVAEARRELGKLFARRAEFDTAAELLEAAEAEQLRSGKVGEALATAVRKRELDILAARGPGTLGAIDNTIGQAHQTEGGSVFLPMLQRLRAWALVQGGRVDDGRTEMLAALSAARRRNDAFETALLVDALFAIGWAEGASPGEFERERRELIQRLGIVTMPKFPTAARNESALD